MSGGDQFRIDCLEAEVEILEQRIYNALRYLQGNQDIGYGLSPVGVVTLTNIIRGEFDDIGTPGQSS